MKLEEQLLIRSENKCELCQSEGSLNMGEPLNPGGTLNPGGPLKLYEAAPSSNANEDNCMMICDKCLAQIEKREEPDSAHWACLTTSMWSETPAVQVVSWRMLNRFRAESWAADSLDMMYLDEDRLAWAKASGDHENDAAVDLHKDCNGNALHAGDTIVLTKSLDVKGSTLNAKMGTVVKNIRLVEENTEQIEGKIEGQVIVILTKYVRKQGN